MTYLGNVLIWWFLLFFSLLSTGISAQDSRPEIIESYRSLNCEYVSAILDSFVQGSPRDVPIIAIASAGKTEQVSLVRQRLNQLRTHLLNYYSGTPWQRSPEIVVTAMSSQLSDEGTLDLYSGGKLRLRIFVRKNRLIRLSPCVTEKPEARIASESPRGLENANNGGLGQPMKCSLNDKCGNQPLGLFAQVTSATLELSKDYNDTIWLNKETDLRENRWTLDPLDEVNPAYKFLILKTNTDCTKEKCGDTIAVTGKLISPTGKLFDFKQAMYDFPSRKLKFKTMERDGVKYEADVQFYSNPVRIGGIYQEGTVKLKASGKTLGTVSMEFPFMSASSE